MSEDQLPDLITDEAKARIGSLEREIEAGVQSGQMGTDEIEQKTIEIIRDRAEDWKHPLIPNDIGTQDDGDSEHGDNSIDSFLEDDKD